MTSPLGPPAAWQLPHAEPTNLVALLPGDDADGPPRLADVLTWLETHLGRPPRLLDELDTDAPEIQWTAAIELPDVPGLNQPLIFWLEPARGGADEPPAAAGSQWAIGVETMFDPADPLTGHHSLMRTVAGSLARATAILDINTTVWRDRGELHRLYLQHPDIDPPADAVWTTHVIQSAGDAKLTWLHTHGLNRCGLPELEMLEVPAADAPAAAMLLSDIAEMLFEQSPTPPGEPYVIGAGLAVTLHPWQEIVAYLSPGTAGSASDREGEANIAHAGVQAVVCGIEPRGSFRKLWTWPEQVIRTLQSGQAALYMTERMSRRQAALARTYWNVFAEAFERASRANPRQFLVKAVMDVKTSPDEPQREHLWFDIKSLNGNAAVGELLNDPIGITPLARGQQATIELDRVSDWQVQLAEGTFGPDEAEQLQRLNRS